MEKIGAAIFKVVGFLLIGPLKKYRAIEADSIAAAMIRLDNTRPTQNVFESNELVSLNKR